MRGWEHRTCVQFTPAKPSTAYILFAERDCGCCSYVGKQAGTMPQGLSIGRGCEQHGTILHELGHSIGFWHEMSRPDRDEHIDIVWANIKEHHRQNFDIEVNVDSLGEEYDPYSIMHYGSYFFTSNGQRTIRLRPGPLNSAYKENQMGQRNQLSASDIRQANRLHKCRQKCGRQIDASNWLGDITHNNVFKRTLCEWRIVSGPSGSIEAQIEVDTKFQGRIRVFDGPYKADNNGLMVFDSKKTKRETITSSGDRLVVVIFFLSGRFNIKLSELCGDENLVIKPGQEELLFPAFYPYTRPSGVTRIPPCKWNIFTDRHHILELDFKHFRVEPNELTVDTKNGTRLRIFNGIRSRWTPPSVTSFQAMSIQYEQLHHQRFFLIKLQTYSLFSSDFVLSVKSKTTRCTVDNGGCDHLCYAYDEYGPVECYCYDGYNLQSDLKTCRKDCMIDFDLNTTSGIIENNNFGKGEYDHDQFCEWTFYKYPPGYAVVFDNFTVNLEQSPNCVNDYLLIGQTSIYCGFAVITGHQQFDVENATVTFKSNSAIARSGFHFTFRILSPVDRQCEIDNGGCSSQCRVVNQKVKCSCFSDSFELGPDGKTCEFVTSTTTTTTTTMTTTTTTLTTPLACHSRKEVTRLNGIKILPRSTKFIPVNQCVTLLTTQNLYLTFSIALFQSDDCSDR